MITRYESDGRMSQVVAHGDTLYLAGQLGEPDESVADQTRTALAEIERLLALAGSDKNHLLMATIWLADMADFEAMNAVWDAWMVGVAPPGRATGEARLAAPEYRVEIIVTAARR